MNYLRNKDTVSGFVLTVVSVLLLFATNDFAKSSISSYGNPATVPRIVIALLLVLSVMIMFSGMRQVRKNESSAAVEKRSYKENLPFICTFILLCLYILLLKRVGYILTTIVYLFGEMFILSCFNRKKIWKFLIISCIASPILYFGFRIFFDVFLPIGILG